MKTLIFIIFILLTIPTSILGIIWRIATMGFDSGTTLVEKFIHSL